MHHTKDVKVLDEVPKNTTLSHSKVYGISLNKKEMRHLDEYANSLNNEIIEQYDRSIEKRDNYYDRKDNKKIDDNDNSEVINKEVKEIKGAIKTLEVMGHILKNHSGEIEKARLIESLQAYYMHIVVPSAYKLKDIENILLNL